MSDHDTTSGWRRENPDDPLDQRMRWTTRLVAVGLKPRVGETTVERERRFREWLAAHPRFYL